VCGLALAGIGEIVTTTAGKRNAIKHADTTTTTRAAKPNAFAAIIAGSLLQWDCVFSIVPFSFAMATMPI
jgi:hypothetical protein